MIPIILSVPIVSVIRRELRKVSSGVQVTEEEIVSILNSEVLKRDIVQGESAEEALKHVKKALSKQTRKKEAKKEI